MLYIGINSDFGKRWKDHTRNQPWWDEHRRMAVEWCSSRPEAEAAETAAIKAENPEYNVVHSGTGTVSATRPPVSDEQSVARKIKNCVGPAARQRRDGPAHDRPGLALVSADRRQG